MAAAPLTGLGWTAAPDAAPAGWTAITVTAEGAAANLGRGFGHKGGGYLCVRSAGDQAALGSVVTDVQVLSERSPQPPGYIRAPEFPEPRAGLSRKKRLYVKLLPPDAVDTAVLDVKLSAKSKALPQYLRVGELGNFAIWCKKGPVPKSSPPPVPKPRTLSANLKQLSLQPPAPDPAAPGAGCGARRVPPHESLYDASGIYGLSGRPWMGCPSPCTPDLSAALGPAPPPCSQVSTSSRWRILRRSTITPSWLKGRQPPGSHPASVSTRITLKAVDRSQTHLPVPLLRFQGYLMKHNPCPRAGITPLGTIKLISLFPPPPISPLPGLNCPSCGVTVVTRSHSPHSGFLGYETHITKDVPRGVSKCTRFCF